MTGRAVELELGGGGYGGDSATYPMPGTDENLGRLVAYDLKTMKESWSVQQRAMFLTEPLPPEVDWILLEIWIDTLRHLTLLMVKNCGLSAYPHLCMVIGQFWV